MEGLQVLLVFQSLDGFARVVNVLLVCRGCIVLFGACIGS